MARVTLATTELQEAQKMIEAAKIYEKSWEGMALRWMNILYYIGQQPGTNTLILIPANLPTAGVSSIGLLSLTGQQGKKKGGESWLQHFFSPAN